jgi:hypothetical protein
MTSHRSNPESLRMMLQMSAMMQEGGVVAAHSLVMAVDSQPLVTPAVFQLLVCPAMPPMMLVVPLPAYHQ